MKFNEVLRILREEIDMNQKDLANNLNINPATYRNYENGNREPDFQTLINISRFFNVSNDFLLGVSEFKNYECYKQSLSIDEPTLSEDENQLLKLYRKLSVTMKAELRGEMKGILRTSQEEQSASLNSNGNISNKKAI